MLLALETSDRLCAACLVDPASKAVVSSVTLDLGRGHAEKMMDVIADVLAKAGKDYAALSGLSVCVGPGSFTGIRVALATATGLSVALGIPVIGVTALQALALQALAKAGGKPILSVIDAHRGDVFVQSFSYDALPADEPRQIPIEAAAKLAVAADLFVCGSGAPLLAGNSPAVSHDALPNVDAVAHAALNPAMSVAAKPLYLRRPDAKPQESYTQARALRR
jgi:tRNA threonylcarbamoyladenosine biosynthesis protein TsaB